MPFSDASLRTDVEVHLAPGEGESASELKKRLLEAIHQGLLDITLDRRRCEVEELEDVGVPGELLGQVGLGGELLGKVGRSGRDPPVELGGDLVFQNGQGPAVVGGFTRIPFAFRAPVEALE